MTFYVRNSIVCKWKIRSGENEACGIIMPFVLELNVTLKLECNYGHINPSFQEFVSRIPEERSRSFSANHTEKSIQQAVNQWNSSSNCYVPTFLEFILSSTDSGYPVCIQYYESARPFSYQRDYQLWNKFN